MGTLLIILFLYLMQVFPADLLHPHVLVINLLLLYDFLASLDYQIGTRLHRLLFNVHLKIFDLVFLPFGLSWRHEVEFSLFLAPSLDLAAQLGVAVAMTHG